MFAKIYSSEWSTMYFPVILNANSQNRVVLIFFFPTTQQEQNIPKISVCRQNSTTERQAAVAKTSEAQPLR
jgi:hypothetical protein